jgi:hypothetical protein
MSQGPSIYTVRKSWVSAVKRGELKLERERRDLFSGPPLLFRDFDAAAAEAERLAHIEDETTPPLFGWIIGDPADTKRLTLFEVVPVAIEPEAGAVREAMAVTLEETFDPVDGEARS